MLGPWLWLCTLAGALGTSDSAVGDDFPTLCLVNPGIRCTNVNKVLENALSVSVFPSEA